MNRKTFGKAGEDAAVTLLARAGYDVSTVGRGDKRGDLRVVDQETGEVWRVEVKAARRDSRGCWQFCLRRRTSATRSCTDVSHADFALLLAFPKIGNPVPFLIPTDVLGQMKQLVLRDHPADYGGKWAVYRQRGKLQIGSKTDG